MTDSLIERLRKLCTWGVPMVDGKSRTYGLMEAAATIAKQAERIADLEMEVSGIATKDGTIKLQAARIAELEAEVLAEKEENRWAYINAAMEDFPTPTDPVRDGTEVPTVDLHATNDASVWAAEFVRLFPHYNADESNMIGWFANAMAAQEMAMTQNESDPVRDAAGELLEALDNLTIALAMGWDTDGVIEAARAAIRRADGGQG